MTVRRRAVIWGFFAAASAGACNVLVSLDGYAGTEVLPACSRCGGSRCKCAPRAPEGFNYARLLVPAADSDACPSGLVAGQAIGKGALDDGCECSCDSPAPGADCGLVVYAKAACSGTPEAVVTSATCTALPPEPPDPDHLSARVMAASGDCTAKAQPSTPKFEISVLACLDLKPVSDPSCDSESICTSAAAAPFDATACVVAKSELESACPPGYSHSYTFATGFSDQRSCNAASCACLPQPCPNAVVSLCQDSACGACPQQTTGNCVGFGGLSHAKVDVAGKTVGTCSPVGEASATGSVTATGTLLVCCHDALSTG